MVGASRTASVRGAALRAQFAQTAAEKLDALRKNELTVSLLALIWTR